MSLFNSFGRMVEEIPMQGIIGTLELERKMIEDDVAQNRIMPMEAHSILSFCQFIDAAKQGSQITPVGLVSVLDLIIIVFIWLDYRYLKARRFQANDKGRIFETLKSNPPAGGRSKILEQSLY